MSARTKKTQISVYIDPDIMTMLADYAARREQSQSMIAEAAIASFLSPDAAERREAVIAKRLDQLDRRMTRLERDSGIAVESLAVLLRPRQVRRIVMGVGRAKRFPKSEDCRAWDMSPYSYPAVCLERWHCHLLA